MKRCPTCNRTYADLSLNFCLDDGTPLTNEAAPTTDLNATIRYPPPRDTSEPPPTEIYRPAPTAAPPPRPATPAPPPPPPPQWSPTPAPPAKKSNAIWWILGGLAAVMVIGVGLVVMIIALASMSSNTNGNANTRELNRNANVSANANANANANVVVNANVGPPSSLIDDFSQQKWGTGTSQFGGSWYKNDEYHMSSKEQTFVVMYAPSNDYSTENATVKVTARSVDGGVPSAGFGLMVHCVQSRQGKLEDYALLIFPSDEPEYEIIMHKAGEQQAVVQRTKSSAIQSGSAPNELEVRIKGNQLVFVANGRILTTVTDRENYRKGRVGFYTSDIHEVAFDDLKIERTQ
ncbi:MAG TPA: hypothetical protein VFM63_04255 [Pyrinomonadaceae bacterium]|nr:hypothetical protein [Pyrinomonadaceae bacterium]